MNWIMKWKNSAFRKKLRSFLLEYGLLSPKETIVICSLSLILELCCWMLSIPSFEQWELTVKQDTTLFSLLVIWEVMAVCLFVLIPVLLIVSIILWCLLRKNFRKLKKANQQRGKTTSLQNNPFKRRESGNKFITLFVPVLGIVTLFMAWSFLFLFECYYGVFKQAKMYYQLKKQLKSVLQEQDTALEKP
ncbi:hypothetical protein ME1_00555 [Bartonella vinsonii subsp. arupensis OK-94-513]|uniref:Uncharacterized protein n=1 Tax=Bartonella vinsonii subsp. arupensis OK-94-513 TaxID=1094562 RepID=J1JVI3_BARVI|nr:hypothetical protein ME1_00555 [Bartonella vinsonii subsp. arupensis OK-94-513]